MLKRLFWFTVILAGVLAVGLRVFYGGGESYRDLTRPPALPPEALEEVLSYPEPIGNVAVSDDGRVFFTVHPESRPTGPRLLVSDGQTIRPFPDAASQDWRFVTPLGMVVDQQRRLWVIDHGNHGLAGARLLAFDIDTGQLVHEHHFHRSVAPRGSFLQDLQIDARGTTIYIADVSFWRRHPALLVYDVNARTSRRLLERDPSVMPQDWIIRTATRSMTFLGGLLALKPGVDGIALSRDGQWLYYGAMAHEKLYRVATADLRNANLSELQLTSRVEVAGDKPLSDGLSIDDQGVVYITDVEHGAVMSLSRGGALDTLVASGSIRWADALSFGPGGYLYIADSAIPDQMLRSRAHIAEAGPYHIYRFQTGATAVAGQ